jgi:hypothetical protein
MTGRGALLPTGIIGRIAVSQRRLGEEGIFSSMSMRLERENIC